MTLGEMLRQERMGAGMADQKSLDAQYARAIMGDGKFQVGTLQLFFYSFYGLIEPKERSRLHRRQCRETRSTKNALRRHETSICYSRCFVNLFVICTALHFLL